MENDKRCTICGDIGFEELMATCSNCKIACEHLYCMASSNGEVPEEVPDHWTCEICLYIPDADTGGGIGKESFQNTTSTVHHYVVRQGGATRRSRVSDYARRSTHSVKTGKVKFLSTEEVMRLSSGAAKVGSPTKSNLGNRHGYSSLSPKFSSPRVKKDPSFISFSPKKSSGVGRILSSSITSQQPQRLSKDLKEHSLKDTVSPAEGRSFKEQKITSIKPAKEVKICKFEGLAEVEKNGSANVIAKKGKTCNMNAEEAVNKSPRSAHHLPPNISSNSSAVDESKKSDVEVRDLLTNLPNLGLYHHYFPALHVIWKGGFKFIDTVQSGKFYAGFQAQPPSRVSRRAYELAQKMPIILQIELLPCHHVWGDLFQNDYPDFRDIALYFLPSENIERSKDNLTSLFELMENQNSALRSYVNDVELLIFTSKQLHGDSQDVIERSGMEQFLWGVFRHTKGDQCPLELDCTSAESNDVVDMEIDMVSGQVVGRVDVVIKRESSKWAGGESDKKTVKEDAMKMSNDKISSAFEEDSTIEQLRLESEQAQQHLFSLFSDVSQKIKSNSVEKSSAASIPPGFEEWLEQRNRNMPFEAKFKEPNLNDGRVSSLVEKDIDLQRVGNPQSCPVEVKIEEEKLECDRQPFSHRVDPALCGKIGNSESWPMEVKTKGQKLEINNQALRHRPSTKSAGEACKLSRWSPPPIDWVKLNVVGRSKEIKVECGRRGLCPAGASGIIRDEYGKWLLGYPRNLGTQTSIGAELWGLFEGLKLAWSKGFRKVVVETESSATVQYLKKSPTAMDPNRALVECCMNLVKRDWVCQVVLVDRDANLSANWLANHFEEHPFGLTVMDKPPNCLVPILQNDYSMEVPCHSSSHQQS